MPNQVVLVAVDNSEVSYEVVKNAAKIASALAASIYLVHVVDQRLAPAIQTTEAALAKYYLRRFNQLCAEEHVVHTLATVATGTPTRIITQLSNLDSVTLTVVGAIGRDNLSRQATALGHVAQTIATWSTHNTVIIHPEKRAKQPTAVSVVPIESIVETPASEAGWA